MTHAAIVPVVASSSETWTLYKSPLTVWLWFLGDSFGRTSFTWDQQSRLLTIQNPLNELATIQWDNLDREQHRVLGNGGTISHTWDAAGRETLIENRDKNGVGQFIATNTYSPVDNRLTVLELDSTRATYAYDVASQIVNEARGGTMAYARSYIWDPLGNRIQQYDSGVLTAGTFNKANQLTLLTPATGPTTVSSYDATGNLILQNSNGALTTQSWSPENRLASYSDPAGNSEQFVYSDDGLKKQRTNASGATLFTYDEAALLLETDTSNNLEARYTNSPETWGGLASQSRSSVSSFYGFDSQLSARILVSIAGVITDSYSYKAFGEELQSGSGTVNTYRYGALALYYRELADLVNAWNRWTQPSTGRFRSPDMLGFDGGSWNLYPIVENNPVTNFDPIGFQIGMHNGPHPPPPPLICWPHWSYCGPNGVTDYDPCCTAGTKCNGAKQVTPVPISGDDAACKDHDCCWATVQKKTGVECGPLDSRPACTACNRNLCSRIGKTPCNGMMCQFVRGLVMDVCWHVFAGVPHNFGPSHPVETPAPNPGLPVRNHPWGPPLEP